MHAALDAGQLDEPGARVLSDWTTGLTPDQARAVCATLLARASTLTTGQMIEQVKKMAVAVDPDWARRRYEEAVADRKVVGSRNPDCSANLSGLNLPVDRVAAASARIDALAKAAKHAGDPRPIDHIRADLLLGMTDGTYTGLDDTAILNHLRATQHPNNEPGGPDDGGPEDDGPSDGGPSGPDDGGPDDGGGAAEGECFAAGDPAEQRGPVGAGMELRVQLSTLLGLDAYPGELPGWGPVHAELASTLACGQATVDDDVPILGRPPPGPEPPPPAVEAPSLAYCGEALLPDVSGRAAASSCSRTDGLVSRSCQGSMSVAGIILDQPTPGGVRVIRRPDDRKRRVWTCPDRG